MRTMPLIDRLCARSLHAAVVVGLIAVVLSTGTETRGSPLQNPSFETGDFSGWTIRALGREDRVWVESGGTDGVYCAHLQSMPDPVFMGGDIWVTQEWSGQFVTSISVDVNRGLWPSHRQYVMFRVWDVTDPEPAWHCLDLLQGSPAPLGDEWSRYSATFDPAGVVPGSVYEYGIEIECYTVDEYGTYIYIDNVVVTALPEPLTLSLLALGGLGMLVRRRRKYSALKPQLG